MVLACGDRLSSEIPAIEYDAEVPAHAVLGIAYDPDAGTLMRHGRSDLVRTWAAEFRATCQQLGIADRLPIDIIEISIEAIHLDPSIIEAVNHCIGMAQGVLMLKKQLGIDQPQSQPSPF